MVRRERQSFVDVRLEHRECLAWQAVDEVEADVFKACRTCFADGGARIRSCVDATDAMKQSVVERLNAEGEAVHTMALHQSELGFVDGAGVAFYCKFDWLRPACAPNYSPCRKRPSPLKEGGFSCVLLIRMRQKHGFDILQQSFQQFAWQDARRAAADVDGGGLSPFCDILRAFQANLLDERIHIRFFIAFFPRIRREVAVKTFLLAKRDVDIHAPCSLVHTNQFNQS